MKRLLFCTFISISLLSSDGQENGNVSFPYDDISAGLYCTTVISQAAPKEWYLYLVNSLLIPVPMYFIDPVAGLENTVTQVGSMGLVFLTNTGGIIENYFLCYSSLAVFVCVSGFSTYDIFTRMNENIEVKTIFDFALMPFIHSTYENSPELLLLPVTALVACLTDVVFFEKPDSFKKTMNWIGDVTMIAEQSLGAAISEESFFRGVMLNKFTRLTNEFTAPVLTGAMFSILHLPSELLANEKKGWRILISVLSRFVYRTLVDYGVKNMEEAVTIHFFLNFGFFMEEKISEHRKQREDEQNNSEISIKSQSDNLCLSIKVRL
jgi:membrane protease YdiL (CAAX protease family)